MTRQGSVLARLQASHWETAHEHLFSVAYYYSEENRLRGNCHQRRIVPKKDHTTLVIWQWFGNLKSDQAQTSIRCKICLRPVLSRTGNANNLSHRLQSYHSTEHSESLGLCYHASVVNNKPFCSSNLQSSTTNKCVSFSDITCKKNKKKDSSHTKKYERNDMPLLQKMPISIFILIK